MATDQQQRQQVLRLLIEHRNSLFAFIYAAMRDYDAAEEVLQEVSVTVCESGDSFQMGTNFGAWSREIARRRILAYWRSRDRRPNTLSEELLSSLSGGFEAEEQEVHPVERRKALRLCLGKMKPFLRKLVESRYADRRSLSELANEVSRKPESVRKSLYRARVALRRCIEYRLAEQGIRE